MENDVLDMNEEELDRFLEEELERIDDVESLDEDESKQGEPDVDGDQEEDDILQDAWDKFTKCQEQTFEVISNFEDDFDQLKSLAKYAKEPRKEDTLEENIITETPLEDQEGKETGVRSEGKSYKGIDDIHPDVFATINDIIDKVQETLIVTCLEEENTLVPLEKGMEKIINWVETQENAAEESRRIMEQEREAHKAFLRELEKDLEEKEEERVKTIQYYEQQRKNAMDAIQREWEESDAAVLIQKIVRRFLSRCVKRKRKSAVNMIQFAMRSISNKLKGLKLRKQYQKQIQLEEERKLMEAEDRRGLLIRCWVVRQQQLMEKEDDLSRCLREYEHRNRAMELQLMYEEDLSELKRRVVEKQMQQYENNLMFQEDQVIHAIRKRQDEECNLMSYEEKSMRAFENDLGFFFTKTYKNKCIDLSNQGLSHDFSCVKLDHMIIEKFRASGNQFQKVASVAPRKVLAQLLHLQLDRNTLIGISRISVSKGLTHLDLSENQLSCEALIPIKTLQQLEVLSLSGNPLLSFPADQILHPVGNTLRELFLDSCQLETHPTGLVQHKLINLSLRDNKISTEALFDQSSSLPLLKGLNLEGNRIRFIGQRSAHVSPCLERLSLAHNPIEDWVNAIVEHIHLRSLNLVPLDISKDELCNLAKYLKQLDLINDDTNYKYNVFAREITLMQSAWRGVRRRMKIRLAMMNSRFTEDDDEELVPVDVDEFIARVEDDDEEANTKFLDNIDISKAMKEYDEDQDIRILEEMNMDVGVVSSKQATPDDTAKFQERLAVQQDTPPTSRVAERKPSVPSVPAESSRGSNLPGANLVESRKERYVDSPTCVSEPDQSSILFPDEDELLERHSSREVDAVSAEWGFSNAGTAAKLMKRRDKNLKAARKKERESYLADPVKRYQHLMKRIKHKGSSASQKTKSSVPTCSIKRDRQQYAGKKPRANVPAWARPSNRNEPET